MSVSRRHWVDRVKSSGGGLTRSCSHLDLIRAILDVPAVECVAVLENESPICFVEHGQAFALLADLGLVQERGLGGHDTCLTSPVAALGITSSRR